MVHLTLAIGDFLLLLVRAVVWAGAGIAGWILLGAATIGAVVWLARRG